MNRYKVTWYEHSNRHGGVESHWVKVDATGYVPANSGSQAICYVKGALGRSHLNRYKCKNFKADKR